MPKTKRQKLSARAASLVRKKRRLSMHPTESNVSEPSGSIPASFSLQISQSQLQSLNTSSQAQLQSLGPSLVSASLQLSQISASTQSPQLQSPGPSVEGASS